MSIFKEMKQQIIYNLFYYKQIYNNFKSYLSHSRMTTQLSPQTIDKIQHILSKLITERTIEENHFLYMFFKNAIKEIKDVGDWLIQYSYIQFLQLRSRNKINKESIVWIYILKGEISLLSLTYHAGQFMEIDKEDLNHISFKGKGLYVVLTVENREKAKKQAQKRRAKEQKILVKGVLFENISIPHKQFNFFWSFIKQFSLKKGEQFPLHEVEDMIFIIMQGSLIVNHNWKRVIRLRQLSIGSIFSTYLGRYFYKTGKQLKNMQKLSFSYRANQDTLIFGFSADIFDQQQELSSYRFVISHTWNIYMQRVTETKRIIQQFGLLKPERSQVIKTMQSELEQSLLKSKIVEVPVIVEGRKLKGFAGRLARQKSNRRKLPNLATTELLLRRLKTQVVRNNPQNSQLIIDSEEILKNSGNKKSQKNLQKQANKKSDAKTQIMKKILGSGRTSNPKSDKSKINQIDDSQKDLSYHQRTLSTRNRTLELNKKQDNKTDRRRRMKTQVVDSDKFSKFCQLQQFFYRKLKSQFQTVILDKDWNKDNTIINPFQTNHQFRKYHLSREQLEECINTRRVMKFGITKKLPLNKII